jgi:hypothetical protein
MREIALFAGALQISFKYIFLISLARTFMPFFVRKFQYGSFTAYFTWESWLYTTLEIVFTSFIVFLNYTFVFAGLVDFQRRMIMLKACGSMLEPVKTLQDPMYRTFPTVNYVDPPSLHSWFQMRLCLIDLGRKYMSRIFIYSSTFLGCYFFYLVILILNYFEFISLEITVVSNCIALYDIIFTLGVILLMFIYGANVNHQYVIDQLQLLKIKQILIFTVINFDTVMDTGFDVPDSEVRYGEGKLPRLEAAYTRMT